MKHSDYWRGRFEQLNESLLRQGVDYYDKLERPYRQAAQNIERDIAVWYQRLAANNGISYSEAKRLLNANELKEFRWTVEDYIERGKENGIDQRWAKQLENTSAKVHISRLEALKMQTQQHLEVLYGGHLDGMDKAMRGVYEAGYYHTAFEVQRGLNVGYSFQQLDDERLQKIISKPWAADGKNFSDRIWQDKTKLINTMHAELTQATIRGDPPLKITQMMSDKLQVSRGNAGRLVMTESAFFASASQRDCFTALDVEEYEIIAALDSRTSPVCRDMDGKVFKQSDYKPGITAPPFHCWCRSCTAPYFADDKGSRAARGEDGKTYYVPSGMKYEDWKKVYVDQTVTPEEWQKARENGTIKKTLQEKIQEIRDKKNGVYTEDDIKLAGAIIKNELVAAREEYRGNYEAAREAYEAFGWDRLLAEKRMLSQVHRGLRDPSELGYANKEEAYARFKEIERQMNTLADNKDMHNAWHKLDAARRQYTGTRKDNIEELKKKLSEIRTIGCRAQDINAHLNHSRSSMTQVVIEAYEAYPSEWVEKSIKMGTLTPKKVQRGYYNGREIAISGDGERALSTAIHELGHRFERAVAEILASERFFYERRTQGEELEWLGGGYARSEETRKDQFIDTYMGKDYGGRAYELVSMGFQYAYTEPLKLWEDEDMSKWIYGILSLL